MPELMDIAWKARYIAKENGLEVTDTEFSYLQEALAYQEPPKDIKYFGSKKKKENPQNGGKSKKGRYKKDFLFFLSKETLVGLMGTVAGCIAMVVPGLQGGAYLLIGASTGMLLHGLTEPAMEHGPPDYIDENGQEWYDYGDVKDKR